MDNKVKYRNMDKEVEFSKSDSSSSESDLETDICTLNSNEIIENYKKTIQTKREIVSVYTKPDNYILDPSEIIDLEKSNAIKEKINKELCIGFIKSKENNFLKESASIPLNNNLEFDSLFESGNLMSAYKIARNEYDLILSSDSNYSNNNQCKK